MIKEKWIFDVETYAYTYFSDHIKNHYLMELSYYISGFFFLFCESKMSDFYQMLIHHIITVFLLVFSMKLNFLRYGILLMILHDFSDPIMEMAKVVFYLEYQTFADILFIIFANVFYLLRLVIYPYIIYKDTLLLITYIGYLKNFKIIIAMYVVKILLFVLNLIWGFFIAKMMFKMCSYGNVKGDIRAEDDFVKKTKTD